MNSNPEVDKYLEKKNHPLSSEIQKVREIILKTDDRIEETMKWSYPTFIHKSNIASFLMNAKKFVSLMFHKGAIINEGGNYILSNINNNSNCYKTGFRNGMIYLNSSNDYAYSNAWKPASQVTIKIKIDDQKKDVLLSS